jgi:hypothetical protein
VHLVTSLTVDASLLCKLIRLWDEGGDPRNPFARVLVTPLFASPSTLRLIREELKEKRGAEVTFDSGGYYVQQGKIAFEQLYRDLRDFYRQPANQWADWYVLPDHVPTSLDPADVVEAKVNDTITAARVFLAEMPAAMGERTIPVIQGHTFDQVNRCLEAFLDLGASYMGFGSFGTNGAGSNINVANRQSAGNAAHLAGELGRRGLRLHAFGVSTPPLIFALKKMGFHSFDSLAWQRSAAYGKAYLPFTRAYNVSHRSTRNGVLTQAEFEAIKEQTGHRCPFCDDFRALSSERLYRSLHNLAAVMDTVGPEGGLSNEAISGLIAERSARYYDLFEELILDGSNRYSARKLIGSQQPKGHRLWM